MGRQNAVGAVDHRGPLRCSAVFGENLTREVQRAANQNSPSRKPRAEVLEGCVDRGRRRRDQSDRRAAAARLLRPGAGFARREWSLLPTPVHEARARRESRCCLWYSACRRREKAGGRASRRRNRQGPRRHRDCARRRATIPSPAAAIWTSGPRVRRCSRAGHSIRRNPTAMASGGSRKTLQLLQTCDRRSAIGDLVGTGKGRQRQIQPPMLAAKAHAGAVRNTAPFALPAL